jgi:hypothetical protein
MPLNDSWIVTQDDDFPTLAGLHVINVWNAGMTARGRKEACVFAV